MDGFGRWAGRSSVIAGLAGAAANTLLLACLALLLIRPDVSQEKLGSLAALLGGTSSLCLAPVAVVLGGRVLATLGVVAAAALGTSWFLFAAGTLPVRVGAPVVATAGLLLAAWLLLVCAGDTVPPRTARFGRRCATVAMAGTLAVSAALTLLPWMSSAQLTVLVMAGAPGATAWFAVPAWSLRMGKVLGLRYAPAPGRGRRLRRAG